MKTKLYNLHVISMITLLMTITACSLNDEVIHGSHERNNLESYEDIIIAVSDLPLFADFGWSVTKSEDGCQSGTVSLESLIDRDKTTSKTFKQYRLTEIPFIRNATPSCAILSDNSIVTDESCTAISLFLVETTDTVMNVTDRKVVTKKTMMKTNSIYSYEKVL